MNMHKKIFLVILIATFFLTGCTAFNHKKEPLSLLMGKTPTQLAKQLGTAVSSQKFPPTNKLREELRLIYSAEFYGQKGDLMCSIDNQTHTVTFLQFYVETGNYLDDWVAQISDLLGPPYTQEQWIEAINEDRIYKDRSPQLIKELYSQGARQWPLTKDGYQYEIAAGKFAQPQKEKSEGFTMIEATWVRIFDTKAIKR